MPGQAISRSSSVRNGGQPPELMLQMRPRSPLDKAAGHTGMALGLGPAPDPGSDRIARRLGLGLFGTLASIIWMWSLSPPLL